MTEVSQNVNPGHLRVKWREEYVTQGINQTMAALGRGVYRGFWIAPSLSANQELRVLKNLGLASGVDTDNFAMVSDRDNRWALSVNNNDDFTIDMSDFFSGGPLGSDTTFWVFIAASYSTGAESTAEYRVSDVDPRSANPEASILGTFTLLTGATVVDFDADDYATIYQFRTEPGVDPAKELDDSAAGDRRLGLMSSHQAWALPSGDQKDALDGADAPDLLNPFTTTSAVNTQMLAELMSNWVKRIEPETSPSGWQLMWRSHGVTDDASVVESTSSLYWGDEGFALVKGGYLSGTDLVRNDTIHRIAAIHIDHFGAITQKIRYSGPLSWNFFDSNEWINSTQLSSGLFDVDGSVGIRGGDLDMADGNVNLNALINLLSVDNSWIQGSDGELALGVTGTLFRSGINTHATLGSTMRTRIMYFNGAIRMLSNCYWDKGETLYKVDDSSQSRATMLSVGTDGIVFYVKDKDDTDDEWSDGWSSAKWTASMTWMGGTSEGADPPTDVQSYNCAVALGELYERFLVNQSGNVHGTKLHETLVDFGACQFRNKWVFPPTGFYEEREYTDPTAIGGMLLEEDVIGPTGENEHWGIGYQIKNMSGSMSDGAHYHWKGLVTVTT